jgi:hypothetical protein
MDLKVAIRAVAGSAVAGSIAFLFGALVSAVVPMICVLKGVVWADGLEASALLGVSQTPSMERREWQRAATHRDILCRFHITSVSIPYHIMRSAARFMTVSP